MKTKVIDRLIYFFAGIGLAGLMFLTSCAPIYRHDRIVRKYPFVHKADSILIRDTVRVNIPEVRVDTVVMEHELYDTITLRDTVNRVEIKVWKIKGEPEKIYIQGKAKEIIIEKIIERKVPVTIYEERNPWLRNIVIWFVVIFIILSLINHYLKSRKHEENDIHKT